MKKWRHWKKYGVGDENGKKSKMIYGDELQDTSIGASRSRLRILTLS